MDDFWYDPQLWGFGIQLLRLFLLSLDDGTLMQLHDDPDLFKDLFVNFISNFKGEF